MAAILNFGSWTKSGNVKLKFGMVENVGIAVEIVAPVFVVRSLFQLSVRLAAMFNPRAVNGGGG